jgi:Fe-S-cluster containining protein
MLEFNPNDELFLGTSLLNEYFDCANCGFCCKAFETVPIYPEELSSISSHLSLDRFKFKEQYTKPYDEPNTTVLRSFITPCPFLEKKRCVIYPHRPFVCQSFPLVINLEIREAVLSGIYFCPQATQFYEGLIDFYSSHDPSMYRLLINNEKNISLSSLGWKLQENRSIISSYIDWLYRLKPYNDKD